MDLYIVKRDFVLSERRYLKGDVVILNNGHICFLFNLINEHLKREYGFYEKLFEDISYTNDDYYKEYNGKNLYFCADGNTNLRFLYCTSIMYIKRNICFVAHLNIPIFNGLVKKYNINTFLSNEEKDNRFKKVIYNILKYDNKNCIKLSE